MVLVELPAATARRALRVMGPARAATAVAVLTASMQLPRRQLLRAARGVLAVTADQRDEAVTAVLAEKAVQDIQLRSISSLVLTELRVPRALLVALAETAVPAT